MLRSPNFDRLREAAELGRERAYAPHSHYQVGAAILGVDGVVYHGCNIENDTYGLTICAERVALAKMVSEGCQQVVAVVVITKDGGTPCGLCRQMLVQFAPEPSQVAIWCLDDQGNVSEYTLSELLPHEFRLETNEG